MSNSGDFHHSPSTLRSLPRPPEDDVRQSPVTCADPRVPLLNLSAVRARMDSLHRFLSDSVNKNDLIGKDQMDMVSAEISSAIHQIILNGAALLASAAQSLPQTSNRSSATDAPSGLKFPVQFGTDLGNRSLATDNPADLKSPVDVDRNLGNRGLATDTATDLKFPVNSGTNLGNRSISADISTDLEFRDLPVNLCDVEMKTEMDLTDSNEIKMKIEDEEMKDEIPSNDMEIIELDAVELLAEHVHFCDICGKGFKRDANLRMHMRAHGNQFKTQEALAKPERLHSDSDRRKTTRFSCPFVGCNRNKMHKKFRPLKSVICVKNHFKRSHCPKMYSCNRCNKKSFSVVADLKSHLKHCGESKWKCSCGTTFSRKDKLFGHMALFEGHMPAVAVEEEEKAKSAVVAAMEEEEEEGETGDNGFFEGLLDGFGSIDGYCLQDVLGSPNVLGNSLSEFYNF